MSSLIHFSVNQCFQLFRRRLAAAGIFAFVGARKDFLSTGHKEIRLVVISCIEEKERNSNPNTFRQKSDLGKILSVSGDGMSLQPVTYRALLHLIDGNLNF